MDIITIFSRYTIPLITVIILVKCIMTLLLGHPPEKTYGYIINMMTGERYALNMWETSIGRSSSCDIVIAHDLIPRFQAVISRRIDGWYIYDVFTRSQIKINGKAFTKKSTISPGDIISLADLKFRFDVTNDPVQRVGKKKKGTRQSHPSNAPHPQSSASSSRQQKTNDSAQTPLLKKNMDTAAMRRGSYTIETPDKSQGRTRRIAQPYITNKDTGETFILCGNEVTIGSGRRCDIVLASNQVAKLHAVLVLYEDGWAIENAAARGTALNGKLISSPQLLFDGDVIALADERLYFNTSRN